MHQVAVAYLHSPNSTIESLHILRSLYSPHSPYSFQLPLNLVEVGDLRLNSRFLGQIEWSQKQNPIQDLMGRVT